MITFNKDDGYTEAVVRGFKTQGAGVMRGVGAAAALRGRSTLKAPHICIKRSLMQQRFHFSKCSRYTLLLDGFCLVLFGASGLAPWV